MKKMALITCILVLGPILLYTSCEELGSRPSENDQKKFARSAQFQKSESIFVNRRPNILEEMNKRIGPSVLFKFYFESKEGQSPKKPLPQTRPEFASFLEDKTPKVIWFGHSTFLLNMSGITILVDPVFSDYASPVSFMIKRFQPPVITPNELPEIDYIVISHDHYDHLDYPTIKAFLNKKNKFLVPLGVGSHLRGWGISSERIIELDWWESQSFKGIEFIATPAQHFSGRSLTDKNHTLWASWVVKGQKHSVYFTGDSGYDIHFKTIGEKYGPFDMAFIENGQYNKIWKEVHLLPEQFYSAYKDLRARRYFPVHWGAFDISEHTWKEPIESIYQISKEKNLQLVAPQIGEVVPIAQEYETKAWWGELQ